MGDNNVSLEEFWNVVRRLNTDVKICMTMLDETAEDDSEGKSIWRRMTARAVFALMDSAIYGMMFQAFAARNRPDVSFSLDELTRLETAYDFDEDREPAAIFSRTQTLDDIRFAFNAVARVHYSDYILPIHEPGWILIKEIVHIRSALQYSRETSELRVHEENVDTLVEGLGWLLARIVDVFKSCIETMSEYDPERGADDELVM
ncbi:MAG: hypothetical protein H7Z16_00490 [Pyrinomonadaceae bacterium]|nr:hypothetical protein [Pyrinomonadaceae bacterium]